MQEMADTAYVCKLDKRTVDKAKKELNEDPKDRLNAVNALRTWIQQQPHITIRTGLSTASTFLTHGASAEYCSK